MREEFAEDSLVLMIFSVLVLLGCILFPALMIFSIAYDIFWWSPVLIINLVCFILALIFSKKLERHGRAQKIRLRIQSKRPWMSLADYGANYGKVRIKGSERKSQSSEESWALKKVLEKSKFEPRFKKP